MLVESNNFCIMFGTYTTCDIHEDNSTNTSVKHLLYTTIKYVTSQHMSMLHTLNAPNSYFFSYASLLYIAEAFN